MVGHNGEAQLTREQRLNLEMHQSAEEHFEQNTVMQQTQALTMDGQSQTLQQQPKDYYQLTDEQLVGHEIKLTAAEERELEEYAGKPPEFKQLSAKEERSMKKWHKSRYLEYTKNQSQLKSYNTRRADYVWMARARRHIEGEEKRAISASASYDEKAELMRQRLEREMDEKSQTAEDKAALQEMRNISDRMYYFIEPKSALDQGLRSYCSITAYRSTVNGYLRSRTQVLAKHPELEGNEEAVTGELVKFYKTKSQYQNKSDEEIREMLKAFKNQAEPVSKALHTAVIPKDTVLAQGIKTDALAAMGITMGENAAQTAQMVNESLRGAVYREGGVCSATAYGENDAFNSSDVELVILAHKGTRGVMAEGEGHAYNMNGSNEVMLAPGQAFRIIKAESGTKTVNEKNQTQQAKDCLRIYVETIPGDNQGLVA